MGSTSNIFYDATDSIPPDDANKSKRSQTTATYSLFPKYHKPANKSAVPSKWIHVLRVKESDRLANFASLHYTLILFLCSPNVKYIPKCPRS